jgi:hypothetical protein
MYQNYKNREITVFLGNARPIKFMPGEYKELPCEGLEKNYASYIRRVDVVKEGVNKTEKPVEKGLISEIKQPEPNKELTKEPVEEAAKKGSKKVIKETPRMSEGYSPWNGESTIATSGRQGKE